MIFEIEVQSSVPNLLIDDHILKGCQAATLEVILNAKGSKQTQRGGIQGHDSWLRDAIGHSVYVARRVAIVIHTGDLAALKQDYFRRLPNFPPKNGRLAQGAGQRTSGHAAANHHNLRLQAVDG